MSVLAVLQAIAVLAILILVHELGHFLAARGQGIHVNRFSIGFGPILWKYKGKETEYALRALPLGGFVGFPDDDPESSYPPNDPNLLSNRPVLDRAIVISAGVIANLIFAYFLLVVQLGLIGTPDFIAKPGVLVPQVVAEVNSVANQAGIQSGDLVLAVNGQKIDGSPQGIETLREFIQTHPQQEISLTIQRGESTSETKLTPTLNAEGKGQIGVQLSPNGEVVRRKIGNIFQVFSQAAEEFQKITILTVQGFGQLISNFQETANKVSGPVAIVAIGADIAKSDVTNLFQFAILISINLAVINILPLPALDGGQLAFLLIEGLRGKPLPTKIQDGVMQTGLMLLLGLGIFLILRDTANLLGIEKFFQ
ncbi:RIP metalloprotease RseP [Merismopedia glauca]|uniref:RIP metalloprotease RseP n=1 Tax=Merismopedia glauca TaxID=292586 RepID=UPI001FE480D0|nr:RIP metalloprotease RseP [Merismopedia glauca]